MHTRIIALATLKNYSVENYFQMISQSYLQKNKNFVEPGILSGILRLPKAKRYLILK